VPKLVHDWWTAEELEMAKEQVKQMKQVREHWADEY
jgi:hypothetical protein